jgi:hypothetical protein
MMWIDSERIALGIRGYIFIFGESSMQGEHPVEIDLHVGRLAILSLLWCHVSTAHAQTTTINSVNANAVVIQKQESAAVRPSPALPSRQPLQGPSAQTVGIPFLPRELLAYMSPRCAQLFEVELRGGSRSLDRTVSVGLQTEFQMNCPDAVSEARKALTQDKLRKYDAAQAQRTAAQNAAQQDKLTREQCSEWLRILAGKRKRLDSMTEGEKSDHQRFEQNFLARCKGVT